MIKWFLVLVFVVILFSLSGCGNRQERVVLTQATKIEVIGPDPRVLEKPEVKKKLEPGMDNGSAGQVIQGNNMICRNNEDKLMSLQSYTIELLNSLKAKPDLILVK